MVGMIGGGAMVLCYKDHHFASNVEHIMYEPECLKQEELLLEAKTCTCV